MYSITKPRYVASVVMMPSTCTILGCLNLTIMLSSVAKEEYIFMRSAAGTPTILMHLMQTVSAAYSPVWKSRFYGAFVLNHRVVLHAIDATPARWRGDAGSSPLDRARSAASSPRNDLVKNCRVHPSH